MLLPRPHLGRNVVKYTDAAPVGELRHPEVEPRIVDEHQHVGGIGHNIALAFAYLGEHRGQAADNLADTEKRGVAVVLGQVLPSSHSRHQVATPETELGLRVAPQQPLHQIGTVQVAGSFAGNQVIFHLANPPIFRAGRASACGYARAPAPLSTPRYGHRVPTTAPPEPPSR